MKRSQRGAARVSVTWLVVFLVLFFVAAVFGYMGYEAETRALASAEASAKQVAEANERDQQSQDQLFEISKVVGWSDPNSAVARTEVPAMKAGLEEFRQAFPDMGPDVVTLANALPKARDAYLARGREIATLRDSIAALESEKTSLEASLRTAINDKDTALANVQRQLTDDANNAAQRQTELETRIASLNQQRNELDAQLREARNQAEAQRRQFDSDRASFETRTNAAMAALKFLNTPEAPDARVVSVSNDLALGYIDIGANQRLSRGMRFKVVSGSVAATKLKAYAEVMDVKPTRAEVRFYDVVDRFDPVVSGDVVFNPLFDPTGERDAVLCGRFSGQFNEAELKILLANMNIKVHDRLDHNTDYLILGSELYVDEDGTPLETPRQPTELAIYKDAVANGVQIVSIKQLREFFKF
jgi:hypothetical protein